MDRPFLMILNMSFTGAFVVAAVCLARLLIKKAPKNIAYCLWAVAGFRLAFPFSLESVYSLIPFTAKTIPPDIAARSVPRIDSGLSFINDAVGRILPPPETNMEANPWRAWTAIGSWVWLAGAAVMLVFGVACYLRLKRRMGSAIRVEGNLYETDGIQSPFVLGVLKPKIYLPLDLSGQERGYIILHERTHIRRCDHIIKCAAYFILCLHWFNPLAWAAFRLMGLDMEMSCDERVLKELGGKLKKKYSMSLLSLAADRRVIGGTALAFGEDGVKKRIKNVLKFKKSSRLVVALAVAFVTVLSLGLVVSRAGAGDLTDAGGGVNQLYALADYYEEDGRFSDLGLALDEKDSERTLAVTAGDILTAGGRRYEVAAESLTLSFFPQPSLDQVIRWWTDCLDDWAESGKITAVS